MSFSSTLSVSFYRGKVFRNIATCFPTQNLLDDLCDSQDFGSVDEIIQLTSEIDHQSPHFERPFQYGNIQDDEIYRVFEKERWGYSRFSDGRNYGVWYGAEDQVTSIYEASWWILQLARDNVLSKDEVYTADRAMYQARLESHAAIDLTLQSDWLTQLTHPQDYAFCHRLGWEAHHQGWDLLRTYSARREKGICTPVFSRDAIQYTEIEYYLRFHINPDEWINISCSRAEQNFSFRHG